MQFKLNLIAPINDLGYGIHSRGIISGLSELGLTNYYLSQIGQRSSTTLTKEEVMLLNQLVNVPWDRSAPCVKIWHEFQMTDLSGAKLIAYPVFETTKLIPKAVNELKQMDAVFVTSEWAKRVMIDNIGKGVPIFVVPEAGQTLPEVDVEKSKTFTFLHIGKYEYRKCTAEIVHNYIKVFSDMKEDTRLILHCFNPFDKDFVKTMFNNLGQLGLKPMPNSTNRDSIIAYKGNAVVEIPKTRLSKEDLAKLYKKSHVGLYPSRAEGWNLDLFESISSDLPCIVSNVAGHTEYCKPELGFPEELLLNRGKEEPAFDGVWFRGDRGNWVTPNWEEFREKLLYAYTDYNNIRGSLNYSRITSTFNWANSAKKLLYGLDTICDDLELDMFLNLLDD